jgi:hypothetical protein
MTKKTVLFICIGNSGRSQMAESFFEPISGGWNTVSAGKTEGEIEVRLNRNRILITVALVLFFGLLLVSLPQFLWIGRHLPRITNIMSLRDVHLCVGAVICPSPYLSGTILVNGSVPLSTLHLFINGTDEGTIPGPATTSYATNLLYTSYAFVFSTQPNNPAMPIIAGKTYTIMVVATFQDNSTCTVSAEMEHERRVQQHH